MCVKNLLTCPGCPPGNARDDSKNPPKCEHNPGRYYSDCPAVQPFIPTIIRRPCGIHKVTQRPGFLENPQPQPQGAAATHAGQVQQPPTGCFPAPVEHRPRPRQPRRPFPQRPRHIFPPNEIDPLHRRQIARGIPPTPKPPGFYGADWGAVAPQRYTGGGAIGGAAFPLPGPTATGSMPTTGGPSGPRHPLPGPTATMAAGPSRPQRYGTGGGATPGPSRLSPGLMTAGGGGTGKRPRQQSSSPSWPSSGNSSPGYQTVAQGKRPRRR
ncbi:hypothetical protein MMC10_006059 [Thelotrema lepadinum]|nr:hypothetical protein [Thelotrema lepadinum]